MHDEKVSMLLWNLYPTQDPVTAEAMGLIPVKLDIQEMERRKSGVASSHVNAVCSGDSYFYLQGGLRCLPASPGSESSLPAGIPVKKSETDERSRRKVVRTARPT